MTPGRFISLEGGEGVGKSTQATHLADALRERGIDVVVTREPGGTPGAEAIRTLLMAGSEDRWSARSEALLFAAARADHVEKVILPALSRAAWVICDRYIDSTRAYQGGAGGLNDKDILAMHQIGSNGLLPDRTLLFQVASDAATSRAELRPQGNADRFGTRDAQYHARLDTMFRKLAQAEPDRIRIIDASTSVEAVTTAAMAALSDFL